MRETAPPAMGPTTAARLRELLARIADAAYPVLVVGDLCLDRYLFGQPSRVSREAPIVVLDETRVDDRAGGGAAPALALAALGCTVAVVGVIGDDAEGQQLRSLFQQANIRCDGLVIDASRPTTTKTRVVAEGTLRFPQQLVRLDRQERAPVAAAVEQALADSIITIAAEHGASSTGTGTGTGTTTATATAISGILVSDYRSGVTTSGVVAAALAAGRAHAALTTVDSQGELEKFRGYDLVKCNQAEAEQGLGHPLGDRAAREAALRGLHAHLGVGTLLVTRGGDGASLQSASGYAEVPSTNRSEVYDVTGAGDTVVAVMTAALLAGATPVEAAQIAQIAAGIVVQRWGNAQATRADLEAALA